MPLTVYKTSYFKELQEEELFEIIIDKLYEICEKEDIPTVLIGNLHYAERELDGLLLRENSITILEFKNIGGTFSFSEEGEWTNEDNKVILGGSSINPYVQTKLNRDKVKASLKEQFPILFSDSSDHTSAIIIFKKKIKLNRKPSRSISAWLKITDIDNLEKAIRETNSPRINLTNNSMMHIVKELNIDIVKHEKINYKKINQGLKNKLRVTKSALKLQSEENEAKTRDLEKQKKIVQKNKTEIKKLYSESLEKVEIITELRNIHDINKKKFQRLNDKLNKKIRWNRFLVILVVLITILLTFYIISYNKLDKKHNELEDVFFEYNPIVIKDIVFTNYKDGVKMNSMKREYVRKIIPTIFFTSNAKKKGKILLRFKYYDTKHELLKNGKYSNETFECYLNVEKASSKINMQTLNIGYGSNKYSKFKEGKHKVEVLLNNKILFEDSFRIL